MCVWGEWGRRERGDEEQCILGEREHEKVGMEWEETRDEMKGVGGEIERYLQS